MEICTLQHCRPCSIPRKCHSNIFRLTSRKRQYFQGFLDFRDLHNHAGRREGVVDPPPQSPVSRMAVQVSEISMAPTKFYKTYVNSHIIVSRPKLCSIIFVHPFVSHNRCDLAPAKLYIAFVYSHKIVMHPKPCSIIVREILGNSQHI